MTTYPAQRTDGGYHSLGDDYEVIVSAAVARKLVAPKHPPRMGYEMTIATADVTARFPGGMEWPTHARLFLENRSGTYFVTSTIVPRAEWGQAFGVNFKVREMARKKNPVANRRHVYKAIVTKYLPVTDFKPPRIKASEPDGKSVTLPWDHSLDGYGNAVRAAEALQDKLGWGGTLIGGATNDGYAFTFEVREGHAPIRDNPSKRGAVHLRDTRMYVNAGMAMPACKAGAKLLDMDASRLPSTADVEQVTCAKCRKIAGARKRNPSKRNAIYRNRWGHSFTRGTFVDTNDGHKGVITGFDAYSEYAKAYGKQAQIKTFEGAEILRGLDDIKPGRVTWTKNNPSKRASAGFAIFARKGDGPRMHFDGSKFSNNGKPKVYATSAEAAGAGRAMVDRFPILRGYRVSVEPYVGK